MLAHALSHAFTSCDEVLTTYFNVPVPVPQCMLAQLKLYLYNICLQLCILLKIHTDPNALASHSSLGASVITN